MNHKDEVYVRSHYDGMTVMVPGGPKADEVAVIFCVSSGRRLNWRVGGLTHRGSRRSQGKGERLMKTAIVNIGAILSGNIHSPFRDGDAIFMSDGLIQSVGTLTRTRSMTAMWSSMPTGQS